jgi:hypothetical protein
MVVVAPGLYSTVCVYSVLFSKGMLQVQDALQIADQLATGKPS